MYHIFFIDSLGQKHQLHFQPHSYPNLMELIRDQGYEDWGDCRGRAWCATCHIKINHSNIYLSTDIKEQIRIDGLTNTILSSRLACQIALDKKIHQAEVEFIGAD